MQRNDSGFSMASLMVSVGIMGIIAIGYVKMTDNASKGNQNLEKKFELLSIKQTIMGLTDCGKSFSGSCTPGSIVTLKKANDSVLVSNTGTKFGNVTVRAECNAAGDAIFIRATRLTQSGTINSTADADFAKDPLTGKITKWVNADSLLFPSGTSICPQTLSGSAPGEKVHLVICTNGFNSSYCSTPQEIQKIFTIVSPSGWPLGEYVIKPGKSCISIQQDFKVTNSNAGGEWPCVNQLGATIRFPGLYTRCAIAMICG